MSTSAAVRCAIRPVGVLNLINDQETLLETTLRTTCAGPGIFASCFDKPPARARRPAVIRTVQAPNRSTRSAPVIPADPLNNATNLENVGKQTSLFVRLSTVAGERGAPDAKRDIRGFAINFYTVVNNTPVFFSGTRCGFPTGANPALSKDKAAT